MRKTIGSFFCCWRCARRSSFHRNNSQLRLVWTLPKRTNPALQFLLEFRKTWRKERTNNARQSSSAIPSRLLKLSTELKDYVDKSNENILSLDVIKKADEIEKLAHSVKTRMRGNN